MTPTAAQADRSDHRVVILDYEPRAERTWRIARRVLSFTAAVVLSLSCGAIMYLLIPPTHVAVGYLRIDAVSDERRSLASMEARDSMRDEVTREMNGPAVRAALPSGASVNVEQIPDSWLIRITARSQDASAAVASALAVSTLAEARWPRGSSEVWAAPAQVAHMAHARRSKLAFVVGALSGLVLWGGRHVAQSLPSGITSPGKSDGRISASSLPEASRR